MTTDFLYTFDCIVALVLVELLFERETVAFGQSAEALKSTKPLTVTLLH